MRSISDDGSRASWILQLLRPVSRLVSIIGLASVRRDLAHAWLSLSLDALPMMRGSFVCISQAITYIQKAEEYGTETSKRKITSSMNEERWW